MPHLGDAEIPGLQHKYRETVLYFPGQGQTCHAYCAYRFRWAQFIGDADLRFATTDPSGLVAYLAAHPEVEDVLVTGGDPMVMSTERSACVATSIPYWTWRAYGPFASARSPSPTGQRFVTDRDADDVLRLFEHVISSGRDLAVMAHFSHPRELGTDLARQALTRIRSTGALVYCQAPLIGHVNDDARVWAQLWRAELAAGAVPYYMFVERDTGPHAYFAVTLAKAAEIFRSAYRTLPGLARTVRGPVMSTTPGKVVVDGVQECAQGRHFQLRMLQARDPSLVGRPFRAPYDTRATWLDELTPAPDTPADIAAALATHIRRPCPEGKVP
ncbi:KamA family radical SAM protein [Streptomyces sp. G5(2025)]|uniref:KamA family radical SAM protein n=1 Tax=Streptomyces sp. G5(2025) TaxID=3406628 RepID=UPI003C244E58